MGCYEKVSSKKGFSKHLTGSEKLERIEAAEEVSVKNLIAASQRGSLCRASLRKNASKLFFNVENSGNCSSKTVTLSAFDSSNGNMFTKKVQSDEHPSELYETSVKDNKKDENESTDIMLKNEHNKNECHQFEGQTTINRNVSKPISKAPFLTDNFNLLQDATKITEEALGDIQKIKIILKEIFNKLQTAESEIPERNFDACVKVIELIKELQTLIEVLLTHLKYSPLENEVITISNNLSFIVLEVEKQPQLILLCLVEFGYYMFELGKLVKNDILPEHFAYIVHRLQIKLHTTSVGKVIRQIFFVPVLFDPVVTTYFKDRRIHRIENFCNCAVTLLPPDDPRCAYCPPCYRTIEVNFHPKNGRYLGFEHLLNRCIDASRFSVRLVATIVRRTNGSEISLAPKEFVSLHSEERRPRLIDYQSDMICGQATATSCDQSKIDSL